MKRLLLLVALVEIVFLIEISSFGLSIWTYTTSRIILRKLIQGEERNNLECPLHGKFSPTGQFRRAFFQTKKRWAVNNKKKMQKSWTVKFVCGAREIAGAFRFQTPRILSRAQMEEHVAHYLRRIRFVPSKETVASFYATHRVSMALSHVRNLLVVRFACADHQRTFRGAKLVPTGKSWMRIFLAAGILLWSTHQMLRYRELNRHQAEELKTNLIDARKMMATWDTTPIPGPLNFNPMQDLFTELQITLSELPPANYLVHQNLLNVHKLQTEMLHMQAQERKLRDLDTKIGEYDACIREAEEQSKKDVIAGRVTLQMCQMPNMTKRAELIATVTAYKLRLASMRAELAAINTALGGLHLQILFREHLQASWEWITKIEADINKPSSLLRILQNLEPKLRKLGTEEDGMHITFNGANEEDVKQVLRLPEKFVEDVKQVLRRSQELHVTVLQTYLDLATSGKVPQDMINKIQEALNVLKAPRATDLQKMFSETSNSEKLVEDVGEFILGSLTTPLASLENLTEETEEAYKAYVELVIRSHDAQNQPDVEWFDTFRANVGIVRADLLFAEMDPKFSQHLELLEAQLTPPLVVRSPQTSREKNNANMTLCVDRLAKFLQVEPAGIEITRALKALYRIETQSELAGELDALLRFCNGQTTITREEFENHFRRLQGFTQCKRVRIALGVGFMSDVTHKLENHPWSAAQKKVIPALLNLCKTGMPMNETEFERAFRVLTQGKQPAEEKNLLEYYPTTKR